MRNRLAVVIIFRQTFPATTDIPNHSRSSRHRRPYKKDTTSLLLSRYGSTKTCMSDCRVLVVPPNNGHVDEAAERIYAETQKHEGLKHRVIIRVHKLDTEKEDVEKRGTYH